MKWLPPTKGTQHSADGKYCIVRATSQHWVAYELGPTTGRELGVRGDEAHARALCEVTAAYPGERARS